MTESQKLYAMLERMGWDAAMPVIITLLASNTIQACQEFDMGKAGMYSTASQKARELAAALGIEAPYYYVK